MFVPHEVEGVSRDPQVRVQATLKGGRRESRVPIAPMGPVR